MANGNYTVVVDGQRFNVSVFEGDVQNIQVAAPVQNIAPVQQVTQQTQAQATYSGNEVKAPVNGNVWKLLVKEGDKVEKDQQIMILEAMKMEIDVVATVSGTVTKVLTEVNKSVEEGQTLILIS
ncbi:Methylmalonyl-CoA carboxyltransferase 1.3S subunit [Aliarcobacter thereius]|uniref:Biotin/lipoyl-binding protein n=2 Tax=Aliarcobacter thereius TaxID=544718 RepID=A0A1C0B9P7_9BACT|nr:biotin/lipoyl-containing protein [Aliarcobacter thereius]OCL88566.1 Methylmalonyl-CoA carboxyltransferase 1.3S subunit [Aliarcobacter thereius]OCL92057.1 Methylmalonyl-CoA carboxyltransferase 1.3S subunit [Aliarcobacter thereius]OCL94844.1 Methylmalonyl-CoA carboxyltransferase 1.3S subunit [Aliarcobacter thereius LMG 24486]OCM00291.1 Methylmalonyl-CoA carboxyltransferase 1.3S subunit [Aliarcobacter thereius]QBF15282.1 biotin attachment protein [Aliarcobacter thereius LMG 24486]